MAAGWGIAAVSTLAILVLTLRPSGRGLDLDGIGLCVICGEFGLANILRNVVLFMPLGAGLGIAIRRPWLAWLPAVALTAFIEAVQLVIPGRNSLLVDLVANSAGAGLGILYVRAALRPLPSRAVVDGVRNQVLRALGRRGRLEEWRDRGYLALGLWTTVSALALVGTAVAFQLTPPAPPHFIQIHANLGHFDRFPGSVEQVTLGDEELRIGRYPDPERLERRLFGGLRSVVRFTSGAPTRRIAPLLSIYTGAQREVFVLGVQEDDAVVRLPYRAASLRLDRPAHRFRGVLTRVAPESLLALSFRLQPAGLVNSDDGAGCLELEWILTDGSLDPIEQTCGLRPSLAEGWSLLMAPDWIPEVVGMAMGGLWLLGLGFVPGVMARGVPGTIVAALVLVLTGAAAPWAMGSLAGVSPWHLPLLAVGVAVGSVVGGTSRQLAITRAPVEDERLSAFRSTSTRRPFSR